MFLGIIHEQAVNNQPSWNRRKNMLPYEGVTAILHT